MRITRPDYRRELSEGRVRSGKLLQGDFFRYARLRLAEAVPSFALAGDNDARPGVQVRPD